MDKTFDQMLMCHGFRHEVFIFLKPIEIMGLRLLNHHFNDIAFIKLQHRFKLKVNLGCPHFSEVINLFPNVNYLSLSYIGIYKDKPLVPADCFSNSKLSSIELVLADK